MELLVFCVILHLKQFWRISYFYVVDRIIEKLLIVMMITMLAQESFSIATVYLLSEISLSICIFLHILIYFVIDVASCFYHLSSHLWVALCMKVQINLSNLEDMGHYSSYEIDSFFFFGKDYEIDSSFLHYGRLLLKLQVIRKLSIFSKISLSLFIWSLKKSFVCSTK